jgi:hypothetical protein
MATAMGARPAGRAFQEYQPRVGGGLLLRLRGLIQSAISFA